MINAILVVLLVLIGGSTIDTFDIKCTGDVGMEDLRKVRYGYSLYQ